MKIRNGFVSNSSSSSFIIIAPAGYDYTKDMSEDFAKIYEDSISVEEANMLGQQVDVYMSNSDDGVCWHIVDSSEFQDYCKKNELDDDAATELAAELYDNFCTYFNKDCYVKWLD